MIRMVLVMSVLAIVCIVAAAILHFQMPDSSLPVVILGLASATIVPAAIASSMLAGRPSRVDRFRNTLARRMPAAYSGGFQRARTSSCALPSNRHRRS